MVRWVVIVFKSWLLFKNISDYLKIISNTPDWFFSYPPVLFLCFYFIFFCLVILNIYFKSLSAYSAKLIFISSWMNSCPHCWFYFFIFLFLALDFLLEMCLAHLFGIQVVRIYACFFSFSSFSLSVLTLSYCNGDSQSQTTSSNNTGGVLYHWATPGPQHCRPDSQGTLPPDPCWPRPTASS